MGESGNLYPIYPLFPCSDFVSQMWGGGVMFFLAFYAFPTFLEKKNSGTKFFSFNVFFMFLCHARYDRWDIMFPGCPSVRHALGVPLCVQCPAKAMPFQPFIMHALQCQHDLDVHLLFCVDLDLHINSFRGHVLL